MLYEVITMSVSHGRFEFVIGQFNSLAKGISEINRIHKSSVNFTCVLDAPFIQSLGSFDERGTGNRESDVVKVANPFWIRRNNFV